MKLPKGITGFKTNSEDGVVALSDSDIRKILGIIKAYRNHRIIKVEDVSPSNNYYRVKLVESYSHDEFDLLINPVAKYSCCVTFNSEWMNLEFIETPNSLKAILDNELNFISKQILVDSIHKETIQDLDKVEIDQLKYWKTKRIGDLIFNGYD